MHVLLRRSVRGASAAAVLLLLCATSARAQVTDATVKGRVVDASGDILPGAVVTARHTDTGARRETTSDAAGTFLLAGLTPGVYTLGADVTGFRPFSKDGLRLTVGETADVTITLGLANVQESVEVTAGTVTVAVSREGRLSDTFGRTEVQNLPLPQRDVFLLPRMSAGAAFIPGAANSTKLSSSPVIAVNGNRYRGNNYVLDGAMNTNPNNTGEPAIVPSLEAVEEVQVQTLNFAAEFGRGNGAVINVQTRSGTNQLRGRAWEYFRSDALNARNYFSAITPPQTFNQFGTTLGGPIFRNQTFFFGSYEGTRNEVERPYSFQVETPELREYVLRTAPTSVAARLLRDFAAPAPDRGSDGRYLDQRELATPAGNIPAIGRANVLLSDNVRFDQYFGRVDHVLGTKQRLSARWIGEHQRDEGGTSSAAATLGRALRGSRGPFRGFFGNLNLGAQQILGRAVNDARVSYQVIDTTRGAEGAVVPTVNITGITAPFGDVFKSTTKLSTFELRDVLTLERGAHAIRFGGEVRRVTKGLSIGQPTAGSFTFTTLASFVADRPFRQQLTVDPVTGEPTAFPRYFTQFESGLFFQDQWTINSRLSLSLGLRHDYFGTVAERDGLLSSIVLGQGETFRDQIAGASLTHVDRLYSPEKTNFSPRIGLAWDPTGRGRMSIRSGFSLAYQPHHGQSISGARALPPDALDGVIQPSNGIGTRILYDIPVPFNPEFGRGLNASGGVQSRAGEPPIRITGFVVNPTIKTQYTESWFLNGQRRLGEHWVVEVGYVGTQGVNLERIDDANRFTGDLLDGREDRLNPNFGVLLFVTNGVSSTYHAVTAEIRREFSNGFSLQANYRRSRWLDTSSDTSTGQFQDNAEPGKGAQDISCLRCERAPSLFDVPHRFASSLVYAPAMFDQRTDLLARVLQRWQVSAVVTAQSGRPFSVWNGAAFSAGGDYNADGGGGAVGGGFYDRPDAPEASILDASFSQDDYLNGLFPATAFPKPTPGTNGTLGRNTFRGPRYATLDLSLTRTIGLGGPRQAQLRLDVYNALNTLNLFLPNADLSVSNFGKSTQAFDARVVQLGVKVQF